MCRLRGICNLRRKTVDCSLMQPSKKGSSYNFYFMSRILYCCTAALFSIVAALSPPPIASRFRDVIFRRRSPFVDSDFESLPQLYFPSSQPFATPSVTSSVVATFRRLRPQVASAALSSVVAAFRRLLPSAAASGRKSLPRLYLPPSQSFTASGRKSSQPFVDSFHWPPPPAASRLRDFSFDAAFRRRSSSSTPASSRFRDFSFRPRSPSCSMSAAVTDGRSVRRSDGRTVFTGLP